MRGRVPDKQSSTSDTERDSMPLHAQDVQPIRFTVRMIPTAKGRPRAFVRNGQARIYTPAKTAQAEQDFIALADPYAPAQPFDGPVALSLRFTLPIPSSWSSKKRQAAHYVTSKPDLDNYVKACADAMTSSGRWWRDDSQIACLVALKRYGPAPQIDVEVMDLKLVESIAVPDLSTAQFEFFTQEQG